MSLLWDSISVLKPESIPSTVEVNMPSTVKEMHYANFHPIEFDLIDFVVCPCFKDSEKTKRYLTFSLEPKANLFYSYFTAGVIKLDDNLVYLLLQN